MDPDEEGGFLLYPFKTFSLHVLFLVGKDQKQRTTRSFAFPLLIAEGCDLCHMYYYYDIYNQVLFCFSFRKYRKT